MRNTQGVWKSHLVGRMRGNTTGIETKNEGASYESGTMQGREIAILFFQPRQCPLELIACQNSRIRASLYFEEIVWEKMLANHKTHIDGMHTIVRRVSHDHRR